MENRLHASSTFTEAIKCTYGHTHLAEKERSTKVRLVTLSTAALKSVVISVFTYLAELIQLRLMLFPDKHGVMAYGVQSNIPILIQPVITSRTLRLLNSKASPIASVIKSDI